jgi:hypothetical protein
MRRTILGYSANGVNTTTFSGHAELFGIQHFLLKIAICQFFGHGYVCLNDEYYVIKTKFSPIR